MKKIFFVCLVSVLFSACASLPFRSSCPVYLEQPSFFSMGEKLAAFRLQATGYGASIDGILQIKLISENTYEITVFSALGGYRILQAVVYPDRVEYPFLLPDLDRAVVKAKLNRFWKLLIFKPGADWVCKKTSSGLQLKDKNAKGIYYTYLSQQVRPASLTYKGTFSSVELSFDEYAPYETGELAHHLVYKDGAAEVDLTLLTLKK